MQEKEYFLILKLCNSKVVFICMYPGCKDSSYYFCIYFNIYVFCVVVVLFLIKKTT